MVASQVQPLQHGQLAERPGQLTQRIVRESEPLQARQCANGIWHLCQPAACIHCLSCLRYILSPWIHHCLEHVTTGAGPRLSYPNVPFLCQHCSVPVSADQVQDHGLSDAISDTPFPPLLILFNRPLHGMFGRTA